MSTYTDLHMRRRENLTILRHPGAPEDGITPQRVIFANPENIYEGTFKGRIDATSVDLSAATLTNVKINGAVIQDAMISSEGRAVSIVELTSNLSELSGKVDGLFSTIEDLSSTVDNKLEKLSIDISEETDSKLSSLSLDFIEKLKLTADILSTGIEDEVSARIAQYNTLSDQMSNIETVASDLKDQIVSAQLSIDAMSKQVDIGLSGVMHYHGALLSGYDKSDIREFLFANFKSFTHEFSKGDQFKILSSIDKLYANDYILFNQNIVLSAVDSYDSIDIIRDAQAEGEHLKSLIDTVSVDLGALSTETTASLSQIDSNIIELSGKLSAVSSSVELSIYSMDNSLDTTISRVDSAEHSISCLRSNLSSYTSTLCGIDRSYDEMHDISSDNLILTDVNLPGGEQHKHDQYYMTFLSGTIVIRPLQ